MTEAVEYGKGDGFRNKEVHTYLVRHSPHRHS